MDEYYTILGIPSSASADELKRAYRDLTKVWHPDRFPGDPRLQAKAQEKLKEINNAYDCIRNFRQGKSEPEAAFNTETDQGENPGANNVGKRQVSAVFFVAAIVGAIAVFFILTLLFG